MLNNSYTVSDENLFAATIILRMLEEMDGESEKYFQPTAANYESQPAQDTIVMAIYLEFMLL
jgi:hypothetical protein